MSNLINHKQEKLANAIVFFAEKTKYCGKTKMCKLLFFLDFLHFNETGRFVTDMEYFAYKNGPYPEQISCELSKPDAFKDYYKVDANYYMFCIRPIKKFDSLHFSKRELRILNYIAEKTRDFKAEDIINISHKEGLPWQTTVDMYGYKAKISKEIMAQCCGFSTERIEEIIEQERDNELLERAFTD